MSPGRTYLATLFLCACGTTTSQTHADDTKAEVQRGATARERAAEREVVPRWQAASGRAVVPSFLGTSVYLDTVFWFDPKGWRPDGAEECADPLVDGRGVCSLLGPVSEIHDVEGGVSIRFAEDVEPAAIGRHFRCHHLFGLGGLEGLHEDGRCSPDLAGVRFEVVGPAILVLGRDERTIEEIRRRARSVQMPAWRR